jgi:hypothetical protein
MGSSDVDVYYFAAGCFASDGGLARLLPGGD